MSLHEISQRMSSNRNAMVKLLYGARQHRHLAQYERHEAVVWQRTGRRLKARQGKVGIAVPGVITGGEDLVPSRELDTESTLIIAHEICCEFDRCVGLSQW